METAKIRIGKDFTVLWKIHKRENGVKVPYMLTAGKEDYTLRLWTPYGKQEVKRFEINENTIQFDFLGKDQKHLGNYSLELVERKNAIGMVTVDTVGFTLVAFSRYEKDGDNSDIIIQDVKLDSELGLAPMVSLTIDTELSETSHNAVSNYVITEALKNKVDKSELDKKADKKDVDTAINTKAEEIYNVTSEALTGLNNSINQKLAAKVDKVSGKQLSTEDFTTALKQKLQGLNNYDDSALTAAIDSLQNQINTLVSGSASSAIDTFNEIVAFLNGVKNTEDLAGIIASIEQQIASVNSSLSSSITDLQNKDKQIDSKLSELFDRSEELLGGLGKKIDRETAMEYITDLQAKDTQTDARLTELSTETEVLKEAQQFTDEAIKDLQDMKIDREADDYYPQLSVGLADNLAGVDVVDSEFSFRRSGGGAIADGNARIETIKGNSLVWNQKVRNILDTTGAEGWWNRGSTQLTLAQNKIVMTAAVGGNLTQMTQMVGFAVGHKYLVGFDVKVATDLADFYLGIIQSSNLYGNTQRKIGNITQKEAQFATIYTADADMPYFSMYHNVTLNEGDITTFDSIKVIDLTLMFGVGNEPTTIEDLNARKPLGIDEDANKEGEVIHMNAQRLMSCNVDGTLRREQSLDIIGKYFPEGMKSAGTAYDEIRYNKTTQKWEKVEAIGTRAYQEGDADNASYLTDGKVTCYPLAEPIVTELDDDFNLDYEVWNGGTEEVISDAPTTPLKAEIAYGFNAVGKIKDLEEAISNLPSGESSVFKAIYGTTTYEEIKAAYDSGKVVHCDYESYCYTLVRIADTGAYFTCVYSSTAKNLVCYSSNSTWKVAGNVLETTSNKTTTISESSTDTQYPSAKAVYDFVSNTLGTIINGDY